MNYINKIIAIPSAQGVPKRLLNIQAVQ